MRLLRNILIKLGVATAAPVSAPVAPISDAPPMPESEAGQYFRLGEIYKQNTAWTALHSNAGRLSALTEELKQQARQMQAPSEVVHAIDHYEKIVSPLPWDQPWTAWNDADQQIWNTAKPYSDHWNDWLMVQPRDRYFFYMLGRLSMKGWSEVEPMFSEGRESAASLVPTLEDLLGVFGKLRTDTFFAHARTTLNTTVLRALEDLAVLKDRVEASPDGTGGTPEAIRQTGATCRLLRDEAHAGRLTRN